MHVYSQIRSIIDTFFLLLLICSVKLLFYSVCYSRKHLLFFQAIRLCVMISLIYCQTLFQYLCQVLCSEFPWRQFSHSFLCACDRHMHTITAQSLLHALDKIWTHTHTMLYTQCIPVVESLQQAVVCHRWNTPSHSAHWPHPFPACTVWWYLRGSVQHPLV